MLVASVLVASAQILEHAKPEARLSVPVVLTEPAEAEAEAAVPQEPAAEPTEPAARLEVQAEHAAVLLAPRAVAAEPEAHEVEVLEVLELVVPCKEFQHQHQ